MKINDNTYPLNVRREPFRFLNYLSEPHFNHPIHRHSFHPRRYKRISLCTICQGRIWSIISYACECLRCGQCAHRSCLSQYKRIKTCPAHDQEQVNIIHDTNRILSTKKRAREYISHYAPYVAGGIVGALVAGPVGTFAGLTTLYGPILAGFGLGAASIQRHQNEEDDSLLLWATCICTAFKKEELQASNSKEHVIFWEKYTSLSDQQLRVQSIHSFLYSILAGGILPLSQINVALCMQFRARHRQRLLKRTNKVILSPPLRERRIHDTMVFSDTATGRRSKKGIKKINDLKKE